MSYIHAVISEKGKRQINQDMVYFERVSNGKTDIVIAAVCDGMGGLEHGESASILSAYEISKWFRNDVVTALNKKTEINSVWINDALDSVFEKADVSIREYSNMIESECGTTATVLILYDDSYYAASIGDSRIYRYTNFEAIRITHDHSYVQSQIDQGLMTSKEAEVHKMKSVLTKCLGSGESAKPDFFQGKYDPSDVFCVCSDGFYRKNRMTDLLRDVIKTCSPHEMEELLSTNVSELMAAGERDNISAIVISCK